MKGDYKKIQNLSRIWNNKNDNNILKNREILLKSIKKRSTLSSRIVIKLLSKSKTLTRKLFKKTLMSISSIKRLPMKEKLFKSKYWKNSF